MKIGSILFLHGPNTTADTYFKNLDASVNSGARFSGGCCRIWVIGYLCSFVGDCGRTFPYTLLASAVVLTCTVVASLAIPDRDSSSKPQFLANHPRPLALPHYINLSRPCNLCGYQPILTRMNDSQESPATDQHSPPQRSHQDIVMR